MTYQDYYDLSKKNNKLSINISIGLVLLLVITILFSVASLLTKILILTLIGFAYMIISLTIKSTRAKVTDHEADILQQLGPETFDLHYAPYQLANPYVNKVATLLIYVVYALMILLISGVVYWMLLRNDWLVLIAAALHLVLVGYIFIMQRTLAKYQYIFIGNQLIINKRTCVDVSQLRKKQLVKLKKSGYVMDINTSEQFIRIWVGDEDFSYHQR